MLLKFRNKYLKMAFILLKLRIIQTFLSTKVRIILTFRVTQKTTWICRTSMKFIFELYNFLDPKWLDDLKKFEQFQKIWTCSSDFAQKSLIPTWHVNFAVAYKIKPDFHMENLYVSNYKHIFDVVKDKMIFFLCFSIRINHDIK